MTSKELYKLADEVLLPYLRAKGFDRLQPGEYVRRTRCGQDRILVSQAPGARKRTHFCVGLCYYPDYMQIVTELVPLEGEDEGFLCGPYLNPVSVTSRPKYWGYATAEALERSLSHVLRCLQDAGLPWLETLRNPKTFADSADPVAALPAGLANEIAGDFRKARDSYEEMHRRYAAMIEELGEDVVLKKDGRAYVFVTAKLGIEEERRRAFQERLGYQPDIEPLPG